MKTMKKTLFVFVAALCLAPLASAKKTSDPKLLVMSYNIRFSNAKDDGTNSWEFRYQATFDMIADQKPDIVGMQEVCPLQRIMLDEELKGYKGIGVGRDDGKKKGEEMAVFYNKKRVSLLKWGTFWLSETPGKPSFGWDAGCRRTATWALMKDKSTGRKFWFVNTHLDHKGTQAQKQGLKLIVDRIGEMNVQGFPVVLTGDFNVNPSDPCLESLDGFMVSARDAAAVSDKSATYHAWGKQFKNVIDYIYFSGFSGCGTFEVVKKSYSGRTFISDHFPVKATLAW